MKNKFKKSKIIVPALALITATTVASVTGTVAWFTATRAVTVSATTFETRTENSSLSVVTTADTKSGTKKETSTANTAIIVDGCLTHGSYNAIKNDAGNLYSPVIDESTASVSSYNDLGTVSNHIDGSDDGTTMATNKWWASTDSSNTKIWYGVSWTMTFSQAADPNGYTNYLLFDPSGSEIEENNSSASSTNHTLPGFRVALMTSTNCIVVGGDNNQKHVTGTNATSNEWDASTKYTTFNATGVTKVADNATNITTNDMYLGSINATSGIVVTAVAWFEGEDTDAITTKLSDGTTDRIMSKVNTSLNFYSRKA